MATLTTVARRVIDQEPNAFDAIEVDWSDDGYLRLEQGDDTIMMRREHAGAVVRAITDALADDGSPA